MICKYLPTLIGISTYKKMIIGQRSILTLLYVEITIAVGADLYITPLLV
jgi:hypothetical protein